MYILWMWQTFSKLQFSSVSGREVAIVSDGQIESENSGRALVRVDMEPGDREMGRVGPWEGDVNWTTEVKEGGSEGVREGVRGCECVSEQEVYIYECNAFLASGSNPTA